MAKKDKTSRLKINRAPYRILLVDFLSRTPKKNNVVGFNLSTQTGISRETERLKIECEDMVNPSEFIRRVPELIKTKSIDGVLGRVNFQIEELFKPWRQLSEIVPVVNLLMKSDDEGSNFVGSDEAAGVKRMVDHLVAEGHETFGFVAQDHFSYSEERFLNYQRELTLRKKKLLSEWSPSFDFSTGLVRRARLPQGKKINREKYLHEIFVTFQRLGRFPDALLFETDRLAAGFYLEAIRRGLRIPGDVSIAGFDDAPIRLPPYGGNSLTTSGRILKA
jgi:DNA-binding LacI/PurR family transcriptional regulator